MKHRIRTVVAFIPLLVALATVGSAEQQHQLTVAQVVKASVDAVVLINVSDETGKLLAEGSGFIASSDGKIVTNHHVIAGGHSAVAKLNNGAFFVVDGVLADDPDNDIAVIKVTGKNLPYLALAAADSITIGDHVVAIGSPLGLENTVSDGIVSSFREDAKGHSWIQTTAPASHGNSGGPLLTMDAEVAGVVTWKASSGENLNFAVPSKLVSAALASSTVRPFGTPAKVDSSTAVVSAASSTLLEPRSKGSCKLFFLVLEKDEATSNLEMMGLNKPQSDWYRKNGNRKEFAGACLVNGNESGERVTVESASDEHIARIVGDTPLYLVVWEQHRVFVPDSNGGHYAFSSNGTLCRWDRTKSEDGGFVPVGPVHNTNRTILTSSSVSMLKDAVKTMLHLGSH